MKFLDSVSIAGTRKREDGYLVVDARVARTGVQRYLGSEVGKPEMEFVDVYRPPEEVFSNDAMASFAHRPVTDDHPNVTVTAENWSQFAKGHTADEVRQDDKFLRVPLMVADAATIAKVESGKQELSNGYTCGLDFTPGYTPDGEKFDAVQKDIRGNHIAIVQAGRAGSECRIGDGSAQIWGSSPITKAQKKDSVMTTSVSNNMMVDGLPVSLTDANSVSMTITKLLADRDAVKKALDEFKKKADEDEDENKKDMAKKDAALADAQAKILDQAAIDKLVSDRVALETVAKSLVADLKTEGLSDSDVRRAVVIAKLGDKALVMTDGKDATYTATFIDARFAQVVESADVKTDTFRDTMHTGRAPVVDTGAEAKRQAAFDALTHYDQTGTELKVN